MIAEYSSRWGASIMAGVMLCFAVGAAQAQDLTTQTTKTKISLGGKRIEIAPLEPKGLRFNFKGVPLDMVLDYLSKAAGFVIVREATVQGRIDVVSHRDISRDEAVALLNTVLNQKGYAAIRNEQTLKIVTLEDARKQDIPVRMGRDAEQIKKTDEMITQVIPVHYANVTQLIQNLQPLLPPYAVITANESSNAILLTATQTDTRRMVQIISALDTSIANVSTLKVFILNHADATELAKLIGDLFKAPAAATGGNGRGGPQMNPMMMMFGMGRRGFGGGGQPTPDSGGARPGGPVVTAVADTRTNAVVVSAPNEVIPTIEQLVAQIDTSSVQITEIRVFTLHFAEAQNTAQLINDIFQKDKQSSSNNNSQGQGQFGGGFMRRFMGGGNNNPQPQAPANSRLSQETSVLAVADVRTNSVVINADKDLMEQIALMIDKLDKNPAKDKKVFVYPLKYADAQQTAAILNEMFGDGTSLTNRSNGNGQNGIFNNNNQNSNNNSRSGSNSGSGGGPTGMSLP